MSKNTYKFILIGNSTVGKTCLFRKLSTGEFMDKSIASIGVEKVSLDVTINVDKNDKKEKKDFDISLFDTAGQEKFRSITFNYYKGSDGILLLYDITNRNTFDNIELWVDSIKEAIDSNVDSRYAIILVGNKLDLINEDGFERQIKEEEAKNACDKYQMIWGGEISTKEIKTEELNKLFEKYVTEVYSIIGEKKVGKQKVKQVKKYKKKFKCFI